MIKLIMAFIGNLIWFIFGGWLLGTLWLIFSIIFFPLLPFLLPFVGYSYWPFGRQPVSKSAITNYKKANNMKVENYQAVKLLRENLMMLDIKDRYSIEKKDVVKFLKNNEFNDKFDVVFADPPYYKYDFLKIHDMIAPILNDGGVFCYESEYQKNNSKIIQTGLNFKFKRYGNTQVIYWRK